MGWWFFGKGEDTRRGINPDFAHRCAVRYDRGDREGMSLRDW